MPTDDRRLDRADIVEAALEASGQCLWAWDLATGRMSAVHGLFALLGYDDEAVTGRDWLDLVHPDDRAGARKLLDDHIAGRSPRFEAELRLRKSNGEFLRVLSRGTAADRDDSGAPARVIGAHFDISSRATLEHRLNQARKMEAIGLFAAGIAHDFNNLLTVMNGYTELLAQRRLPEEERAFLSHVHSAGAIAETLVRRLLTFSLRRAQHPERIDLNGIVRELSGMLQRILPENIRVVTQLNPRLGAVQADAGSLEQVLMNLVLNARDAMPEGGTLEIETANMTQPVASSNQPTLPPGDYVVLSVSDTGIGMDETTRERAFEPFHTTKPAGAGTGLGLSTVYGIVKQSGGWISVRSKKGSGTTFRVYLPRVADGAPAAAAPPLQAPEGGVESILVVEDNTEVRHFMRAALQNLGYSVAEAAGGNEAAAVFHRLAGRIDLLIIDSFLPDGSGRDVARQLSAGRPRLAVLHISGYGEQVAGAGEARVDFLTKPFTWQVLGLKVREVLRKRKPRRVLVVEHDAEAARFIERTLSAEGFEVLVAENGKSAMAFAERGGIDLVLTGLLLPEQDGIETIIALRKLQPAPPVIAMSADPGGQLLKVALALGAHDWIRKPLSASSLVDLVRRTLHTA